MTPTETRQSCSALRCKLLCCWAHRPLAIAQRFLDVSTSPTTGEGVPTDCAPRAGLEHCEHLGRLTCPSRGYRKCDANNKKEQCANSTNFNSTKPSRSRNFHRRKASGAWDRMWRQHFFFFHLAWQGSAPMLASHRLHQNAALLLVFKAGDCALARS